MVCGLYEGGRLLDERLGPRVRQRGDPVYSIYTPRWLLLRESDAIAWEGVRRACPPPRPAQHICPFERGNMYLMEHKLRPELTL